MERGYNNALGYTSALEYNKYVGMLLGAVPQANPLLASLSLPGRPLQHQLDLKHFLPLRPNGSSHLSLFPNFNTMDPVQKAVINHTFGVAQPKKKQIISCNICHLRFNSTNQAEAHYKGHKHARKLKAMDGQRGRQRGQGSGASRERERDKEKERGKTGGGTGTLLALMNTKVIEADAGPHTSRQPIRMKLDDIQGTSLTNSSPAEPPTLDLPSLLSSQVSPPQQPILETVMAEGCSLGPTMEQDRSGPPATVTGQEDHSRLGEEENGDGKKSPTKQHLHCPVCKVTVNSTSQLEAHYSGSKHKQMLDGQVGGQTRRRGKVTALSPRTTSRTKQPIGSKSRAGVATDTGVGGASQAFHCEVCEVSVNSETQLKQHMSSRRHKDRLAGKPPKPKFSPYTKSQANPLLATLRWSFPFGAVTPSTGKLASLCLPNACNPQTKLAIQKQLSKTMPPGFLTSHLNPAAAFCTMASNPMSLRPPPGPATIIQSPLLSPALFRPAPGPLRATHTPIIFSPY